MKKESMKLLTCMVSEGGWGAVHVLELLRINLSYIISFVIQCLHERAACNSSAAAFVGSLCQVVMGPVPPMYVSSLKEMLDSPLTILSRDKEVLPGWEIARHIIQLLPDKMDSSIAATYLTKFDEDEGNVKIFLEALKNLLLVSKSARDCAFFRATDLLKLFSFSLSNLNERILDINLHISSNIANKKELRGDFLFATHCIQVSTNWVIEPFHQEDVPGNTLNVAECLIPLLHPLWIPALRAPSFIEAVVQFLIMITSHIEVSITANVTRLLERKKAVSGSRCLTDCGTLPKSLLEDAFDLLINCGRVHDSAYVIVKEGFLKNLVTFLEQFKDLESTLAQKVLQCLTILTLHKEAHTALSKIPSWVRVVKICIQSKHLRKNALLILINMISNVSVVKHMLSTEDFLPVVGTLLINCSKDLTAGGSSLYTEADIHLCLVVLWALAANNQRCKTILKRLVIKPHLENLYRHHRHPTLSLKLLGILNS
ncbi:hypothetical protein Anas_02852 [Armadillidium nasatum]|uniref:Rotatin n=1 Tax=Armadillidium nasatum TaxID=96803 RepID=A0A5N5TIH3_9CRUS|nr:hypothetical protein Anas_02852 [Armadillidium nasatum]